MTFHETSKSGIPDIYYIGLGKTASASILHGFPNNVVAHWHNDEYFKRLHGTSSLDNYNDLYDFVFKLCQRNNIKPLIIECLREPVARLISAFFQRNKHKNLTFEQAMESLGKIDFNFKPYSLNLISTYIPELKPYQETELGKFCVLKFEEIEKRPEIFKKIGYKYVPNHHNNNRSNPVYKKVVKEFKLEYEILYTLYSDSIFSRFYSKKEIDEFITKWMI